MANETSAAKGGSNTMAVVFGVIAAFLTIAAGVTTFLWFKEKKKNVETNKKTDATTKPPATNTNGTPPASNVTPGSSSANANATTTPKNT